MQLRVHAGFLRENESRQDIQGSRRGSQDREMKKPCLETSRDETKSLETASVAESQGRATLSVLRCLHLRVSRPRYGL